MNIDYVPSTIAGTRLVRAAIVMMLGIALAPQSAGAQIAFVHHYISTTFPKLDGFGQSVAGDFNNDGKTDYLIGQHLGTREKRQYLFLNNGTAQDWPFYLITTGNTADGGVNAMDVDGDGWLDIVSSGSWFRNNRNPMSGLFTKFIYDSASFGGHDMVIADIDGDGKKDVVVNTDKGSQNGGENGLFWLRIPPDPTQPWTKTRIGPAVHSGVWPAGVGDIDGDGDMDVYTHAWYENMDGKGGAWVEHDNVGFGRRGRFGYSQQSTLVDVDMDGDLDIVHGESDYFDDAKIQWSENKDGKGRTWIAHELPMQGEKAGDFHSVAAADFDGDGDIDIFAAESEWMANRARWFIWENIDGKGTFVRHMIFEGLGAHNAVVVDVDGDGDMDILNKEFAPASWNTLNGGQHADYLENTTVRRAGAAPAAAARRDPFAGADLTPKAPVEPRSPAEQQSKFLLPPGYRMEAILTEPAIQQPAAIAFDGNGRMFVLELRTYMLDADAKDQLAPVSRISRWEDRNNDGVYESHTVFVDSLVFPRFVLPFGANAILSMESNTNDVFKYADTNDDGKADTKTLFTTNYGRLANVEHLQSSLLWALDNWLYSTVNAFRVRWTPTEVLREPTGFNGAQWGASQDNDGKVWFQGGASGVPSYFQFPVAYGNFNIPDQYEKGFDDIWGAPLGLADVQGGMDFVRLPDGSLSRATAGSGANVYRGGRLPGDLLGDYFYGEVVGRVVRRVRPAKTEGITQVRNVLQAEKSEFIRSLDPLFRPVEIKTAPDGSMYIVDMYHGVIQESQWTPKGSYLRAKVDQYQLDKIVGLGRIWRLTYDGVERDTTRPRMLNERPAQLVGHLRHTNGWWRDMAQQLLVLKQDKSVAPALRTMVRRDTMLDARVHALWTLEGLGALDATLVREQMRDTSPRMRMHAMRASETLYKKGDKSLATDYRRLTKDADTDVVIQAMLTMNVLKVPDAAASVREAVAAQKARGVQLVGGQILTPAAELGVSGVGIRTFNAEQRVVMERGASIFRETCAQCHGETGLGAMAGDARIAPALAGSPRVTGHPDYAIKTLLHGLTGAIDGKAYAGQIMVSQAQQSDDWIAAVASYIRNSMTNQASFVAPERVAAIRAAQAARRSAWTYPELASSVPQLMHQQSTWEATASENAEGAVRAFGTYGWSTRVPQQKGMWFQFELPEPVALAEIHFTSGGGGPARAGGPPPPPMPFPRGYSIQVSMDGTTWSAPVAEGRGSGPSMAIVFTPVRAKFVRITQTADEANGPSWNMQQMQLYEMRTVSR